MVLALTLLLLTAEPPLPSGVPARVKGPNPYLSQAKELYEELDFEKCLKRISQAPQWKSNATELVDIELYAGMCHYNLNQRIDAEERFRLALRMNPDAELPTYTSPKLVDFFRTVKRKLRASSPPKEAVDLLKEKEKADKLNAEKEKSEKLNAEKAKAEKEKLEKLNAEKAKAEKEKLEKLNAEKAKVEKEPTETELEKEKAEKAKLNANPPRDEPEDDPYGKLRYAPREKPREEPREKPRDKPKDKPREEPREVPRDEPLEEARSTGQQEPTDAPGAGPVDGPRATVPPTLTPTLKPGPVVAETRQPSLLHRRRASIALTVATAIAVGVGIALGSNSRSLEAQANAARFESDYYKLGDAARTSALAADVSFAVGGAAAIGATLSWILSD